MDLLERIVVFFICFSPMILLFVFALIKQERETNFYNELHNKLKKNKEYSVEFERIYENIANSDLLLAQKEKNKKMQGLIILISPIICRIIIYFVSKLEFEVEYNWKGVFVVVYFALIGAAVLYIGNIIGKKDTDAMYREQITKKLICGIDNKITFKGNNISTQQRELYTDMFCKWYAAAELKYFVYMDWLLDDNTYVRIMKVTLSAFRSNSMHTYPKFDGIIAEFSKTPANSFSHIWENRVWNAYDKKFGSYFSERLKFTEDENSRFVELYEKYKIMFKIRDDREKIYISFYTGEMFKGDVCFKSLLNKKKLYNEFVIFTNVLDLIKEIYQIL